jgi:hypothetical protein
MSGVHHARLERKVKEADGEGASFHMSSGIDFGSTPSYRSLATITDVLMDISAQSIMVDARRGMS